MTGAFSGKTVMVTGAGGNLGQAISRRFADAGAKLILVERSPEAQARLTAELGQAVLLIEGTDATDLASVDALVQHVEALGAQIDVLAHTVGGFAMGPQVHQGDLDLWDRMLTLNARSVYVTCGRVARHMVERQIQGRIVAILAKNAYKATAKTAAYSASKAAAQRVLESMAAELASQGITVNGIAPSTIDTPQNRASMPNADTSKWVKPEEIAGAILFLAADESRSINGVTLDISGR